MIGGSESPRPVPLFYSYSHKDEKFREEIEKQLSILRRQGAIKEWHDRKITAGEEWKGEIDGNLENADVILLLISADFLASDYCYDKEMTRAMQRHEAGEAHVIPVILRPCDWKGAPFGKVQALPKDSKPITTWDNADEAFLDVAQGIRNVVEKLPPRPRKGVVGHVTPALLSDLEFSMADGELRDSLIAPIVFAALSAENKLELVPDYKPSWVTTGIRLSDEYFVRVRPSAGHRDWQKDFAQTATPTLVGVAHSLERSPDAQALVIRLCDDLAKRLRLHLIWPEDPYEFNDLTNSIYSACLDATEVDSDWVLIELKGLTVVGPK